MQLNPVAESSGGGGMVTDNGKDRAQIFTTFAKNPSNHHFSSCFCTFRHLVYIIFQGEYGIIDGSFVLNLGHIVIPKNRKS